MQFEVINFLTIRALSSVNPHIIPINCSIAAGDWLFYVGERVNPAKSG